jgi:hypothetical protein
MKKQITILALAGLTILSNIQAVDINQVKQQGHKLNKISVLNYSSGDLIIEYNYAFIDSDEKMWVLANINNNTNKVQKYIISNKEISIEPLTSKEILLDKPSYVSLILKNKQEKQKINSLKSKTSKQKNVKIETKSTNISKKEEAVSKKIKDTYTSKINMTLNKLKADLNINKTNLSLSLKEQKELKKQHSLNVNKLNSKCLNDKLNLKTLYLKDIKAIKNSHLIEISKLKSANLESISKLKSANLKSISEIKSKHNEEATKLKEKIAHLISTKPQIKPKDSLNIIIRNIEESINNINNLKVYSSLDRVFMKEELIDMKKSLLEYTFSKGDF